MSLCMLLLASSILFYRTDTGMIIPIKYKKFCSLSLIFLTCAISSMATAEFYKSIGGVINKYKSLAPLLYTKRMLILSKWFYTIAAIIFILTCIFIGLLMIIFSKKIICAFEVR
jgi:hypothetical protein